MGTFRRRTGQGDRGAAAVETAIVLCFVVLPLIFGIIAYAYMFSFRQALSQAASEGARAAVGAPTNCTTPVNATNCPSNAAAQAAIASALSGFSMSCGANYLACAISAPFTGTLSGGPTCPSSHTCVQVQVSYPYRDHSLLPTVPGFGFTLPSTLSFSSVVQVS